LTERLDEAFKAARAPGAVVVPEVAASARSGTPL
jgi:hypothetical protein